MSPTSKLSVSKTLLSLLLLIVFALTTTTTTTTLVSARQCKALNAIAEYRAESHHIQYIGDLQPVVAPSGTTYQSTNLQILHTQDLNVKSMEFEARHTKVVRVDLDKKAIPHSVITDTLLSKMAAEEGPKTYPIVWALSNIVNVDYDQSSSSSSDIVHTTAGLTMSSILKPCGGHIGMAHVLLLPFDSQAESIQSLNDTFGLQKFAYPFEEGDEKIYNEKGEVLGDQPISILSSMVNLTHIRSVPLVSQDSTIRVRIVSAVSTDTKPQNEPSFTIDYVTAVTTQFSTKLVRYSTKSTGHDVVSRDTLFKTVLLPRVDSSDDYDMINGNNLGVRIELSTDKKFILAVVNMNRRQLAAFKTIHDDVEVEFDVNKVENAPLLLKIDIDTGKVVDVVNLSADLGFKSSYATSMDVKEDRILVSANTDNFAFGGAITESQTPFVTLVTGEALDRRSSYVIKASGLSGKQRFVAHATSFSVGSLYSFDDRITVGGNVVSYASPDASEGKLYLIELKSDEKEGSTANQLYDLRVGYSGSNTVTFVKRALLKIPIDNERYSLREEYLLGCIFDAPTTAPPAPKNKNWKFRTAHSGLWQVDCDAENMNVHNAFSVLFYVIFGINSAVMFLVIVWNTIRCGLDYRQAHLEEKALAMEGIY